MTFVLLGNPDEISLEIYVKKLGPDISHLFGKGVAVHAMRTLGEDDGGGGGSNFGLCFFLGPPRSNPGLSRW
jgi:hypothetical protein